MATLKSATEIEIGDALVSFPWPVLQVEEHGEVVYILLDPDSYVANGEYRAASRKGAPAIRNLIAFDKLGRKLWEAEFPEDRDYYYKLTSVHPLVANSFSSYRCEIDPNTGQIAKKDFFK